MDNITIGQIAGAFGTLTVLGGFFIAIYKFIKNIVLDKIAKNTEDIKQLQIEVTKLQCEVKESKEERLILLKGQLACLKGLQELNCNGPVTEAIQSIESYLISKSHE